MNDTEQEMLLCEMQHRALDGEYDHEHREHDWNSEAEDECVLHVPADSALCNSMVILGAEMGSMDSLT